MGREERDEFGKRMKGYEQESETFLDKNKWTIVRIDGHGFSKFTKGFKKPFDEDLSTFMTMTARALMQEFKAVMAYTQSDEITLILAPDDNMIYSGRLQKLTSLMASYASTVFNELLIKQMMTLLISETDNEYCTFLSTKTGKAFFDARVFQVDGVCEAYNAFLWRFHDCKKNAKAVYAQSICSHKELHGLSGDKMIVLCLERGHDFNSIDPKYRFGVMIKKENYVKEVENGDSCQRTRFITVSHDWTFNSDNINYVLSNKVGVL